jgi:ATP-dependent DNA helicase RecG
VKFEDEVLRWSTTKEGQFFERKSAITREKGSARPRPLRTIAWDIAETLTAMANADGGELVVGIEDDGSVTGVPHAIRDVRFLQNIPKDQNYVSPLLAANIADFVHPAGQLLYFRVEWSPEVHRLADGRYLLRVNDNNVPFPADQIAALKSSKALGLIERSFPVGATINDIDLALVTSAMAKAGSFESEIEYLTDRQLIDLRNEQAIPRLAALLLFSKSPSHWHLRCGIDFVKWDGTTRRHGAALNISKRIHVEAPLAILIERAYEAILPFIRERQHLQDLFFTETLEYPTFVWQEAIVNAVAHRDYGIQGAGIEIWLFDDHMEIRSPGLPPQPVTIEALNRREHLHLSRNPLMVRVLSELGYMRELGEGIPRMFDEMEREGFYPPRFDSVGNLSFEVTLRNEPVFARETLTWLQQFREIELTGDQKRLLAYAHEQGGRFTSRDYQKLCGLDIYRASMSIRGLIRRGIVRSTGKGSRIYEVIKPGEEPPEIPEELRLLVRLLRLKGEISNRDIREALALSRPSAARLAAQLVDIGFLERYGAGRWTRYRISPGYMTQRQNVSTSDESDS